MSTVEDTCFSRAMTRFLEQQCVVGAPYSIADERLFAHFRAFWNCAPEYFDHPALLGQFRVELVERGFFTEPGGHRPYWLGLNTRERGDQGCQEESDRQPALASQHKRR